MSSTSLEFPAYAMSSDFPSMASDNTVYDMISARFASHIASNENGYCTPSSRWSCPPSPTSSVDTNKADDSHDDSHSTTTTTTTTNSASAPEDSSQSTEKGRRNNRYKNCSESVLSKRRAQNRANQRAYRKRKEQRLEELQQQLDDMSQKNDALCCAYRLLANECYRLRAGQMSVGQSATTWNMNGAGSLSLDMAALGAYSVAPMSTSSPVPESYVDYPGSPDTLWSPYSS
ncbi:AP-1-like transcription factor [Colletotrichum higginsianum]|uniref:AP-1-like transcription factor n=1 Tax=Colletotrichum higginsianum TaxID=80884 RepID=A0A4V4NAC1_9PEZI|nr:AP-1-like transcription factor [Colletotrichum higginsianum]